MARESRLCLICGAVSASDVDRKAHMTEAHPGERISWAGGRPAHVDAAGTRTPIGGAEVDRMREAVRAADGTPRKARPRRAPGGRFAPSPRPVPVADHPELGRGDAPEPVYFSQAEPVLPAIEPAPSAGPSADALASRSAIELALDTPTLAGMIRNLSIVLSDWDGASDAGHLSAIESTQIAMLLHSPTVSAVERFFGGSVDRFRLALAAAILLLGKGRIHVRAIAARRREAQAETQINEAVIARDVMEPVEAVAALPDDPIARLAMMQQASARA